MREAIVLAGPRAYLDIMSDGEREAVDRWLRRLEADPSPDGITTFAVPETPDMFVGDDGTWRLVYVVPDNATVIVRALSNALDLRD